MKPLLLTILLTLSSILSVSANSDTPLNIHTCVNCEQKFTNQETCIHCFYPIHEYIPEFNTAQMKFLISTSTFKRIPQKNSNYFSGVAQ